MTHTDHKFLEKLSLCAARCTGSSWAFLIAITIIIAWIVMGPMAGFSTQWQLTMDTICSITTFLIVFLLQRSQLKDSLAMQIKLSEIIAVLQGANNQLINIEELSEQQILELRKRYQHLASELQEEISTHQVLTSE